MRCDVQKRGKNPGRDTSAVQYTEENCLAEEQLTPPVCVRESYFLRECYAWIQQWIQFLFPLLSCCINYYHNHFDSLELSSTWSEHDQDEVNFYALMFFAYNYKFCTVLIANVNRLYKFFWILNWKPYHDPPTRVRAGASQRFSESNLFPYVFQTFVGWFRIGRIDWKVYFQSVRRPCMWHTPRSSDGEQEKGRVDHVRKRWDRRETDQMKKASSCNKTKISWK